jgi:hypothetical protein
MKTPSEGYLQQIEGLQLLAVVVGSVEARMTCGLGGVVKVFLAGPAKVSGAIVGRRLCQRCKTLRLRSDKWSEAVTRPL